MGSSVEVEILDFWTCMFLDPPPSGVSIELGNYSNKNYTFYKCRAYGEYLGGNDQSDIVNGHFICVAVWALVLVVGTLGAVTNILNVLVLRKSHQGSTLQDLLIILAVTEFLACCSAVIFSYLILSILGNLQTDN